MFSLSPLISLVTFVPMLSKVEMSLQELANVEAGIDAAVEPFENEGVTARWQQPAPKEPAFESLALRDVRFSYYDRNGARLFGIGVEDFELRRGELVFIRGGNGSGKSTFVKVLAGLYTAQSGDLFLNGARVADFDMRCEFPQDARFSPGWDPKQMQLLPELARQLLQRKDLDLVVGMGTAAVKALLAVNNWRLPILGMGMADPIAAGVVKSAHDSGVDNFTCRVTVDRWPSMFRVFYDVVRFHKLGIMYQDNAEGRVYAALDDARAIASELGFSLVLYNGLSSAESTEECRKGLNELHKQGMGGVICGLAVLFQILWRVNAPER